MLVVEVYTNDVFEQCSRSGLTDEDPLDVFSMLSPLTPGDFVRTNGQRWEIVSVQSLSHPPWEEESLPRVAAVVNAETPDPARLHA